MKFNYDYSQTVVLKIGIGKPDKNGVPQIFNTFDGVLEKIREADALTLGAPKIMYLVGWQYGGHDDKYPAFFEVNEHAKRPGDETALQSLLRLVQEAKQYHTVISYHINLSDAYADSPLWQTYIDHDLILRNRFGRLKKTGVWNGRPAYQVRFAEEYRSGFFQKRADRLLRLLPLAEAGTVHIDAFFVRKGKDTSIAEEKFYRRKMIEYFADRGVDVTSEFIYREQKNGYRAHFGKSDVIGLIPCFWHLVLTQKEYLKYPPALIAGGKLNMNLQRDKDLQYLFYGNTTGEGSFGLKDGWQESFTREFALGAVPYFYLNAHRLLGVTGIGKGRKAVFDGGVTSSVRGRRIEKDGEILKENETLCIPIGWKKGSSYAWSGIKCEKSFPFAGDGALLYKITPAGGEFKGEIPVKNGRINLSFDGRSSYEVREITAEGKRYD